MKTKEPFREIEGESIMDRRCRYWRWKRANGCRNAFSKADLGKPLSVRQLTAIVTTLAAKVDALELALVK